MGTMMVSMISQIGRPPRRVGLVAGLSPRSSSSKALLHHAVLALITAGTRTVHRALSECSSMHFERFVCAGSFCFLTREVGILIWHLRPFVSRVAYVTTAQFFDL